MQNRNPRQTSPFQSAFLDQAFARARAALGIDAPTDPIEPAEPAEPPDPAPCIDERSANERTIDQLLDGAELLRVLREPVEWGLALAHQLASGDPVDVAAIARVRAAFFARLAGRPTRIRKTDVLIACGLLIGALDPGVVLHAMSGAIGDGLAVVLGPDTPSAPHATSAVDPIVELVAAFRPQRASGHRWWCPLRSRTR